MLLFAVCLSATLTLLASTDPTVKLRERDAKSFRTWSHDVLETAAKVDHEIDKAIQEKRLSKADSADWATVCRRISLGLVGCSMSLEEYRAIEARTPTNASNDDRIRWWTDYLLSDGRWSQYFAERFSRAFVGTDQGPFLVFRRHRFEVWLAERIEQGTPYDQIVREMIAAEGLWTGNPEVNFLTASINKEGGRSVDPIVLAGRTSRAFLGMRIDCLQCHDDLLGKTQLGSADAPETGKQINFHELAAFYGSSGVSKNPLAGLKDNRRPYKTTLLGESDETIIAPNVPFSPELQPDQGRPREKLAAWVTHRSNPAFARASVNRVWAVLFGKPLVDPVDDIPLHGPFPPALETLAESFIRSNFDLRALVRMIVATQVFQRDSRMDDDITTTHEAAWAVFPLTPLRPEQVAASLHQACRLQMIDSDSSLLARLERYGTLIDFRKDYGDRGEDEFIAQGITIPQRLLVMNGKFVRERIDNNPILNASTQIALLASENEKAVDAVYLAAVNRLPTEDEAEAFVEELAQAFGTGRARLLGDIFWVLLNSTEFAWNH